MNTIDAIYTRRSTRGYLDKPVDKSSIERLIIAATQAPSAMNTQPWAFGVIEDKQKLQEISDHTKAYLLSILDMASALEGYREALQNPDYNIFYGAPVLIIIMAKPDASLDPKIDCSLAAQNLMLMACSLGLGTCWIGFTQVYLNTPEAKIDLGIPDGCTVVAPIIVGYPETKPITVEKNPPEILFWR
ncbi:MAG: nitroreductase [Armatimonadetes bacterium]|nr:nitroreductase [Armatimonadota bacterium]